MNTSEHRSIIRTVGLCGFIYDNDSVCIRLPGHDSNAHEPTPAQTSAPMLARGDEIFIVICHDRHVDDGITVHGTRESADAQIEAFKANYVDIANEWTEREPRARDGGSWVRAVESFDDGPHARIERTVLR